MPQLYSLMLLAGTGVVTTGPIHFQADHHTRRPDLGLTLFILCLTFDETSVFCVRFCLFSTILSD